MGQYYRIVCPQAGTSITPSNIGSGIKALEIVWSFGAKESLALLHAAGLGDHSRDLPWAPKGQWAGLASLLVGDYAEPGDLAGRDEIFKMPEPDYYSTGSKKPALLTDRPSARKAIRELSGALIPVLERISGLRDLRFDRHGNTADLSGIPWWIPVKQNAAGQWIKDWPREDADYYRRVVGDKTNWMRPPVPMSASGNMAGFPEAPDALLDLKNETGGRVLYETGSRVLWVNLDRREFIDPAAMGEKPDLLGVMQGESGRAVLAMITHFERRGGGDLGDLGPFTVAGRWRGDRIVLMGPEGFRASRKAKETVDHQVVEQTYLDISDSAAAFVRAEEILGSDSLNGEPSATPTDHMRQAMVVALGSQKLREVAGGDMDQIWFRMSEPLRLTTRANGKKLRRALRVAPSFDARIKESKVWLEPDIHGRIMDILKAAPARDVTGITIPPDGTPYSRESHGYDSSTAVEIKLADMSNHERIALLAG